MSQKLTVEDLKDRYGRIYEKFFQKDYKPETQNEIIAAKYFMDKHLLANPSEVFETDNFETIKNFEPDPNVNYSTAEIRKYNKLLQEWKRKGRAFREWV
jgi:hypothetical protein